MTVRVCGRKYVRACVRAAVDSEFSVGIFFFALWGYSYLLVAARCWCLVLGGDGPK